MRFLCSLYMTFFEDAATKQEVGFFLPTSHTAYKEKRGQMIHDDGCSMAHGVIDGRYRGTTGMIPGLLSK